MEKSGISQRLIDFCRTLVGHKKSGMAMVCVIVACFFAAISGSGPATVAALGMIIIPAMTRVGYNKASSTALMSTAGAIGIIYPSVNYICYLWIHYRKLRRLTLCVRHCTGHLNGGYAGNCYGVGEPERRAEAIAQGNRQRKVDGI